MAVLTDGQEWHFFLPTEQGDYGERRVYKLDLLERDPQEAKVGFERYLGYEEVRSGRAIEAARRDYRNAARKRTAQRTLPDAWAKLIESEDDILVELLSDKVEDLCGVKPDPDAVAAFLRGQVSPKTATPPVVPLKRTTQTAQPATGTGVPRSVGYTLDGRWHAARSAREVMVKVFDELAKRDPTFLERLRSSVEREVMWAPWEGPGLEHLRLVTSDAVPWRTGW